MSAYPSLRPFYHFPGWVIQQAKFDKDIAFVKLRIDKRYKHLCPNCGRIPGRNRIQWQAALDLPLCTAGLVQIQYQVLQIRCRNCNTIYSFIPPDIEKKIRATKRLMYYVCRLCRFMPVNKIPNFIPISHSTARRWDKKVLSECLPEPDLDMLRVILVDEKSIGKHHEYITVVINGETGDVLHIAKGKKKKSLASFFDKLSIKQLSNIEAVGMDRAGAYKSVVKEYIPNAAIVFDKFHIVANYLKAIDEVRRAEWRKADQDKKKF